MNLHAKFGGSSSNNLRDIGV